VLGKVLTPTLQELKKTGEIEHIDDDYHAAHLQNTFLVIGATDHEEVNEAVARDARAKGIMVNIVDDPDHCDFILPSIYEQEDLLIAISTGGKSPTLAKKLRIEMERIYGPEYGVFLEIMGNIRKRIIARGRPTQENKKIFESLVYSDMIEHIKDKKWDRVRKLVRDITGVDIDLGER
jgi:precorrin-2 dehydrogenase/sirohydrochlorin ferrochelatase